MKRGGSHAVDGAGTSACLTDRQLRATLGSVIDSFFRRRFDSVGPGYPRRAAFRILISGHLIVLIAVLLLELQFDFSRSELWLTVLISQVMMLVDNLVSAYYLKRALVPVEDVLSGKSTDSESTLAAWRILVGLPSRHLKKATFRSAVISLLPVVIWLEVSLSLPLWKAPLIFLAGGVLLIYGYVLRFLIFEIAFRPAVGELSDLLPSAFEAQVSVVSVRTKLLLGLPILNVITGAVVAALSTKDNFNGFEDIRGDVVVVVIVATALSLVLSLLLSRSLLVPIAQIDKAADRARQGDFSVRVPVMTADEIGTLANGFNLLMNGMEQRGRLEEALGTYVDPAVATAVVEADEARLVGGEVDLTVMFIDIRGFTSFAEGASPAAVVARLNEFFEIVIPAILNHGGQPNKFTGDGLMALFGAPEPLQGHADHAVDAALEIVTKVRTRFAGQVELGVGINSGPAVAGRIGGGGKFDFTVVGDTVNTAQRVERATRETNDEILVAGSTRSRLTRDHGGFDERSAVPMSGKQERVRLWAPKVLEVVSGLSAGNLGAVAAAAPDGLATDINAARKRLRP